MSDFEEVTSAIDDVSSSLALLELTATRIEIAALTAAAGAIRGDGTTVSSAEAVRKALDLRKRIAAKLGG